MTGRVPGRLLRVADPADLASIMREHGLVACQPRPYKRTTYSDRAGSTPDLLSQVR